VSGFSAPAVPRPLLTDETVGLSRLSPHRTLTDWALLSALVAMWGSSFMFNKQGLASVGPITLVAARVGIAAIVLIAVVYARGMRLPPMGRVWAAYTLLGLLGNALPFFLITWGQQVVDSAVAGILMAAMPLSTLVLAHFFVAGERMSTRRVVGFAIGFAGVVVLMQPTVTSGSGAAAVQAVSQLAVLGGALCYSANSIVARLLVRTDFLVAAAATLLVATVAVLPIAIVLEKPWQLDPTIGSTASIAWLGLGPTALATILYFRLISSAGPTFMSLVNYVSPAVAVFLGVALLREEPGANAYGGLALILAGIALSQWRRISARNP
jgi:drug/metabolite transporter (DMT)-like permease